MDVHEYEEVDRWMVNWLIEMMRSRLEKVEFVPPHYFEKHSYIHLIDILMEILHLHDNHDRSERGI